MKLLKRTLIYLVHFLRNLFGRVPHNFPQELFGSAKSGKPFGTVIQDEELTKIVPALKGKSL